MIVQQTFYSVKCDNCGKIISDYGGFIYWPDKYTAIDYACENGSHLTEDEKEIYCDDCHEIDDDDNLIIY